MGDWGEINGGIGGRNKWEDWGEINGGLEGKQMGYWRRKKMGDWGRKKWGLKKMGGPLKK